MSNTNDLQDQQPPGAGGGVASERLLPCPFCGGEADYLPDRLMAPGEPPPVFCDGCHASALDAAAWNRRAVPPGFVLLPVEPTAEMTQAAYRAATEALEMPNAHLQGSEARAEQVNTHIYRAMIAAAPEPTP